MTKLNLTRLRYVIPVLLAAFCLARGITLTGAIERSRAATVRTAKALLVVHGAAELVSSLRLGSAEQLTVRAPGITEEWRRRKTELEALSRDRLYGGEQFRLQLRSTSALVAAVSQLSVPTMPVKPIGEPVTVKEIARQGSIVSAGWQSVETALAQRLMVDLAGPENQAESVALLAALACLSCALLLWQTWNAGQLRSDAAMVDSMFRESEARSRAMAEWAREILVQADPGGRVLRCNQKLPSAEMTTLFETPDIWEKTVAGLRDGVSPPAAPQEVWICGEGGGRLMEWRVQGVRDASGALARVDSALLDVTSWYAARQAGQARIGELEQAVHKLQLQLKELLEQSFELAENRAAVKRAGEARMEALLHWGRRVAQPLGEASALAVRLRASTGPLPPEDSAALVQAVSSVANSLRALAEYAGLERGALELTQCAFSPRALLEDCVEAVAGRAEGKHLELPCFVDQGVPAEATADGRRLREVLGHLLEHAIEHTACGEVSVRLSMAARAGVTANLRFEVEDTGAGYSSEDLAEAFEPFHPGLAPQEVASRLAFARRLVEKMGGQFGAESEPGQGTRVWFLIPAEVVPAAAESGEPARRSELEARRILIVDDSASQRGALMELCETLGLRPSACGSEAIALEQLRAAAAESTPFDFVLVDYDLAGNGGAQLAVRVATEPELVCAGVCLLTPYSLRALTQGAAPAGLLGAVAKPVRLRALEMMLTGQPAPAEAPLVLPLAAAHPLDGALARVAGRKDGRATPAAAGSPIVLVVEDNLVNQRVAVRLVEKMGFRTAVVTNGREAIQAFHREPFDLILMDCQMPEMDGFAATAEIRRLESASSRMPIIAMTANAMRGDRERCLAAGMDDYISKPVAYEDLRRLVTRWLARSEATRH